MQLTPLEIEAIAQGSQETDATAGRAITNTTRTVESVRLALGSASMPPAPSIPERGTRGPRRTRETLRADAIKAVVPDARSRKR